MKNADYFKWIIRFELKLKSTIYIKMLKVMASIKQVKCINENISNK